MTRINLELDLPQLPPLNQEPENASLLSKVGVQQGSVTSATQTSSGTIPPPLQRPRVTLAPGTPKVLSSFRRSPWWSSFQSSTLEGSGEAGQPTAECVCRRQDRTEADRTGSGTRPVLPKSQRCCLLAGIELLNVSGPQMPHL